ncbi:hypothetical protein EON65_43395 [archaeon]|nr:MAG: hypothetical protein EON65_43395 [archaeon]
MGVLGHSGVISYRNYDRHQKAAKLEAIPFAADDQLSDYLQTGDILVMKRKWHLQYLPVALNVLLYRHLFDTEFDHVGVILTDKLGKAFVMERSALWGHKVTPFHQRITHSEAELMVLLPLSPRDANLKAESVLRHNAHLDFSSELVAYPSCFLQYGVFKLSSLIGLQPSQFECPNINFVRTVFNDLNARMLPAQTDGVANIELLTDKKVSFATSNDAKKLYMSKSDDVIIRTK